MDTGFSFASMKNNETVLVLAIIPATHQNPTYLRDGEVYRATRQGQNIQFRNVVRGSGTFERIPMLQAFARNLTVTFKLVEEGR